MVADVDKVIYSQLQNLPFEQVALLYGRQHAAYLDHVDALYKALMNAHTLVSAWCGGRLVGIGNAVCDGHVFVYFPHLLVDSAHRRCGIGSEILRRLLANYRDGQQQVAVVGSDWVPFYERCGFYQSGAEQVLRRGHAGPVTPG